MSTELSSLLGSSVGADDLEGAASVDVGVCRLAFPALMAIFAAVSVTIWIGAVCLRKANANSRYADGAQRPKPMRAELEARLRSATALSNEQRKAILDEFCKKEEEQESGKWFERAGGDPRVVAAAN
jgi:hypothetical protein